MEAAKASVKKFMSRDGHHDTTIHETVAPAVQHETVEQRQHERATTAIDKEVHQDHYHTSEQAVLDRQVLPEQHHQNLQAVEHRSFEHDNADEVQRKLAEQQSKYRDHSQRVEGERTQEVQPTLQGEHVHHHVHENIQPIVQKQTVEPHVVHTTKPIHEVHHNAAQHHAASALPAVSMEEFKKQGGVLGGREERHDRFHGCPPEGIAGHSPHGHGSHRPRGNSGSSSSSSSDGEGGRMSRKTKHSGLAGAGAGATGTGGRGIVVDGTQGSGHQQPKPASYGNDMHTTQNTTASHKKPSLMDRLNPKKDADGDGKPGFMK